jgi:hypothetical protein
MAQKEAKAYFYQKMGDYISYFCHQNERIGLTAPPHDAMQEALASEDLDIVGRSSSDDQGASSLSGDEVTPYRTLISEGCVHREDDILSYLKSLKQWGDENTRYVFTFYSQLWKLPLQFATALGLRDHVPEQNWVAHEDLDNLLCLADFERVSSEQHVLIPYEIPFLSDFVNRYLAPLPILRHLCLVNMVVAREKKSTPSLKTVSVVVAARNEAGNLDELIQRLPEMSGDDELIMIEGNSTDNTWEVMQDLVKKYPEKNIRIGQQDGKGKGDAVRKGFNMAEKDILMILDADMTVPPEDLPMFYDAITSGKGEYINGSRLVYPMEKKAMRFINMLGNKFFALAFSFVLGQRFKDTLCGTKVLSRQHYRTLADNRSYFGDFDPFGDFDLIFGASKMGLKIVEVPIRYKERVYGDTNISRWSHGWLLIKMLMFSARKIKFR